MPLAPPIRAIYSAISSGDLAQMRQGLAMGQKLSRQLQAQVAREADQPPPETEEGAPPRQTAAEILEKLGGAMAELEAAMAKVERDAVAKGRGSPPPF